MIQYEIHPQKKALKIEDSQHLQHVLYDYWAKTKTELQTNMQQRYVA